MRLRAAARRLRGDDLLRDGVVLAGASVVAGGLNYAFQVFMGRALSPESYGVFGALFALFYLVNVFTGGIRFSAIRFTAAADSEGGGRAALHGGVVSRAFVAGLVGFAAVALASPPIADFVGLSSVWPVVLVGATVPLKFAYSGNMGSFQGFQWFELQGGYNVLYAAAKLAIGVALVTLGLGLFGAFAALVAAGALVCLGTTLHIRRRLETDSSSADHDFEYATVYRYLSPAVLAGFCFTVPANVDVILVSHFFAGERAGLYVAASVLGKVLIFMPMGISKSMFPKVTGDQAGAGPDRTEALLDRALLYAGAVAGTGALAYWLFPRRILGLFFGTAYVEAAPVLQWYGVAILCFALAIVVLNAELARDRTRFVYAFAVASVAEVGLMWVFSGTMVRIVQVILVTNAALLVYGLYEAKR